MSRRPRLAAAAVISFVAATRPSPAAAHAIDGTFQLPVPLWLYLAGAATAVAASFLVTSLLARNLNHGAYRSRPGQWNRHFRRARRASRPGPRVVVRRHWRRVRHRRHIAAAGRAVVDRDLGWPSDHRGPAGKSLAVAQPVPFHVRRAGMGCPTAGRGTTGLWASLPGRVRALAGRGPAGRRYLGRAYPARQRDRRHRRPADGRLHRHHPGRHASPMSRVPAGRTLPSSSWSWPV